MTKQHIWVPVVLLLAIVWGVFSWRWYTCGVKGFCGSAVVVPVQEQPHTDTPTKTAPEMPNLDDPKYRQKG